MTMFEARAEGESFLNELTIRELIHKASAQAQLAGKRVLVIIPDRTRSGPIPLMFRVLCEVIGEQATALDFLIALGTHPVLTDEEIDQLVGVTARERAGRFPHVQIFNHRWDLPETFTSIGTITESEIATLTDGLLSQALDVRVNRLIYDYDQLIICGPTFPHEVVGFSGGNKYFFPGIGGSEIINFTHWLGALKTSFDTIGSKRTPIRNVIDRAASFIELPKLCFSMVVRDGQLAGLYADTPEAAFSRAADHSAEVHIRRLERPVKRVIAVMPERYRDMWTAAKGMYKLEPIIEDGGECIIYAPHITELSYTHGRLLDEIGYHVRDYFVKQWDRFGHHPGGILAHSTHLTGLGSFDPETGVERPRVKMSLATGIPAQRCRNVNLCYIDPNDIDIDEIERSGDPDTFVVRDAGEILFRLNN